MSISFSPSVLEQTKRMPILDFPWAWPVNSRALGLVNELDSERLERLRAELQCVWCSGSLQRLEEAAGLIWEKEKVHFSLHTSILHSTTPVHTFVDGLAGLEEVCKTWAFALTPKHSPSSCLNPTYYLFPWLIVWSELQILTEKFSKWFFLLLF